jgi:hypothetical protein
MKINNLTKLLKFNNFKIYWPYFIFGIFFVGVIANIAFVFIAKDSWQGVFFQPKENKKLLKKYTELAKKNIDEQKKLGIQIITMIKPILSNKFKLETIIVDNQDKAIGDLRVFYGLTYISDPEINFGIDAFSNNNMYFDKEIELKNDGKWSLETKIYSGNLLKASNIQIIDAKVPQSSNL